MVVMRVKDVNTKSVIEDKLVIKWVLSMKDLTVTIADVISPCANKRNS